MAIKNQLGCDDGCVEWRVRESEMNEGKMAGRDGASVL